MVLIQDVIEGFHRSGEKIVETLKDPKTAFFFVTTATPASKRSSENLVRQVSAMGYRIDSIFLNRGIPEAICIDLKEIFAENHHPLVKNGQVKRLYQRYLAERAVEDGLRKTMAELAGKNTSFRRLEEQNYELHSLNSIVKFSLEFERAEAH
jgi:hypothetical protein